MSIIEDDRLAPALHRLIGVILLGGALGILNSTMVALAGFHGVYRFLTGAILALLAASALLPGKALVAQGDAR